MNDGKVCIDIDETDLFWAWLQHTKDKLITETRGNDRLRCLAVIRASGELYRCSRDRDHLQNHLCIDNGICVNFDNWACGWEEEADEVPHAD
jgi:hypothetical protein